MSPHELRSFGRSCRRIGPKLRMILCEQTPGNHTKFRPCMARSFRGFWCQIGVKPRKSEDFGQHRSVQALDFSGFAKKFKKY